MPFGPRRVIEAPTTIVEDLAMAYADVFIFALVFTVVVIRGPVPVNEQYEVVRNGFGLQYQQRRDAFPPAVMGV